MELIRRPRLLLVVPLGPSVLLLSAQQLELEFRNGNHGEHGWEGPKSFPGGKNHSIPSFRNSCLIRVIRTTIPKSFVFLRELLPRKHARRAKQSTAILVLLSCRILLTGEGALPQRTRRFAQRNAEKGWLPLRASGGVQGVRDPQHGQRGGERGAGGGKTDGGGGVGRGPGGRSFRGGGARLRFSARPVSTRAPGAK